MLTLRVLVVLQCLLGLINALVKRDDCVPWQFNAKRSIASVGQTNCRYHAKTGKNVNYFTCTEIAQKYKLTIAELLDLNPELDENCQRIKAETDYCVVGFHEPVRAWDGKCGAPHGNASCLGTDKQCCNSKTFTCGNSEEDCATGVCYSGACFGSVQFGYSLDGTCGPKHGNAICGGTWGDCCSNDGRCGTGDGFCGKDSCFSGKCAKADTLVAPALPGVPITAPWQLGTTPDGTCGGPHHYTCDVTFGACCSTDGMCGSTEKQCGTGCQSRFGKCNNGTTLVYHSDYGHF
ncbi:carbohydrate-binding module family 18 protein [Dissoconium aciculare CBS 342.82]|uniref:Carbohydrate-binding module family 18 protein n=1 Tax=Dissoconium aciculare CBS 342.82 TaxID=1314786 RepID=A0A6J3M3G7_9PEZI|nr:carbohydrate-binding module family 18 protein [Dissoconium aciculare CBS 342.82]KAF1822571.1 carbohydrate-binding module family 18 protein [Dissoconium aciculare CBS 342.82]